MTTPSVTMLIVIGKYSLTSICIESFACIHLRILFFNKTTSKVKSDYSGH